MPHASVVQQLLVQREKNLSSFAAVDVDGTTHAIVASVLRGVLPLGEAV